MKLLLTYLIVILIFLGAGFFLYKQSHKPEAEKNLPGQKIEIVGAEHLPNCTPKYNSNPPTSGCHAPQPANWGTYDTTLQDEVLVHNLEHGGVWISYEPSLPQNDIDQLKDFARRYRKIIVEPRDANDKPIALVAWGRLQNLDKYDEGAILRFIQAFYDKGPEKAP